MSGLNAFFGPELPRLQREFWTVQDLANELHSMFSSDAPINVGDGLQFQNDSKNPAFTIDSSPVPGAPGFNQQLTINQGDSSFSLGIGGINIVSNLAFPIVQFPTPDPANPFPFPGFPPGNQGGDQGQNPFGINITIVMDGGDDGEDPEPIKPDCPAFIGWVQLGADLDSGGMSNGKLFGWDPKGDGAWLPGDKNVPVDGQLFSGHAEKGEDVAVFGDCKRNRLKAIGSSGFTTEDGDPLGFLKSIDDATIDPDDCSLTFGYTMLYLHFTKGALVSVESESIAPDGTVISRTPVPSAKAPAFVDPGQGAGSSSPGGG